MADDELVRHYKYVTTDTRSPHLQWTREHLLGKGGCGTVWLETRTRHGKKQMRAVKVVAKRGQNMPDRERQALASLARPGYDDYFCRFLGWDDNQYSWLFYMEFFPYGDMRSYMTGDKGLPECQVKDIVWQLASGLEVMHSDGFTHRDLKPENIFVDQKAPNWSGTPSYMAPEVLRLDEDRSEHYSNSVDIWSLGIIAFELASGQRPFVHERVIEEASVKHVLDGLSHDISSMGVQLVQALLAFLPELRPSAEQAREHEWFRNAVLFTPPPAKETSRVDRTMDTTASAAWSTMTEDHPSQATMTGTKSVRRRNPLTNQNNKQATVVNGHPLHYVKVGSSAQVRHRMAQDKTKSPTVVDDTVIPGTPIERTRRPYASAMPPNHFVAGLCTHDPAADLPDQRKEREGRSAEPSGHDRNSTNANAYPLFNDSDSESANSLHAHSGCSSINEGISGSSSGGATSQPAMSGKKGKTKMPKRLANIMQALTKLGYVFEEDGDFVIVPLALEKEQIDVIVNLGKVIEARDYIAANRHHLPRVGRDASYVF